MSKKPAEPPKPESKTDEEIKKEEIRKAKLTVGIYLMIALFILIAIASITYFMHIHNVLLKTVLYVGVAGGMGGAFYGINGFVGHIAEDDFDAKWEWWYLYHPITGFVLGVFAYFLIVGGLLTLGSVSQIDYTKGILLYCSISFIAGFSARKFTEKLNDLASTLFSSSSSTTKTTPTATNLVVSGFPNPATAGAPGSFKVTAKDANGKKVTSYTGTVKITSSDSQAVISPDDYTFQASDKGVRTFKNVATLNTPGTQSITATDTQNNSIKGSQTEIKVNKAAS